MQAREVPATSLICWWNIFTDSYQEVIHSLCRPPRAKYVIEELGEKEFVLNGNKYQRQDFELKNRYQHQVPCSFWYDTKMKKNKPVPCIIYLHGLSSSRIEGNYLRDRILSSMGFSFFVLDLSGSGFAESEYVSFGFFEKEDIHAAIDYLYVNQKASKIGLWGHCIGGAAALLALQDSLEYSYKTIQVPKKQLLQMKTRVRRRTGEVVIKLPKKLPSKGSISSGEEHVLIGVDDHLVGFPQKNQIDHLLLSHPTNPTKPISSIQMVRLSLKVKKSVPNGRNNFIFAMALDSTFGDGEQVVKDMLDQLGKSASKRNFPIPSFMLTAASKIICNSIKTTANFNLKDVQVIRKVKHFRTPCAFVLSTKIDFIRPEHTEALYQQYASSCNHENNENSTTFKSLLRFEGATHEQNRPACILDFICQHFQKQNKLMAL
jgi:hypothetical protein